LHHEEINSHSSDVNRTVENRCLINQDSCNGLYDVTSFSIILLLLCTVLFLCSYNFSARLYNIAPHLYHFISPVYELIPHFYDFSPHFIITFFDSITLLHTIMTLFFA